MHQKNYLKKKELFANAKVTYLSKGNNYLVFLTADHAGAENSNYLKDNKYRVSNIKLSDKFLGGKIAELAEEFAETHGVTEPLEQFKIINEDAFQYLKSTKNKYDVIIGMYHDQVISPMKALFGFDAINITLGLPFTRISPDHGPNYSMLGKNLSDPKSLIQALKFLDK